MTSVEQTSVSRDIELCTLDFVRSLATRVAANKAAGHSAKSSTTGSRTVPPTAGGGAVRSSSGSGALPYPTQATASRLDLHLQLMSVLHSNLHRNQVVTQRSLYYSLTPKPESQDIVNRAISYLSQDVLKVPRAKLFVESSSKGLIAGCLSLDSTDLLRSCPNGYSIPGNMPARVGPWLAAVEKQQKQQQQQERLEGKNSSSKAARTHHQQQQCEEEANAGESDSMTHLQPPPTVEVWARYIIIVEKDTVFTRLLKEGLFDKLPCILITGKGFPDLATRAMVKYLTERYPDLQVLGLCDYNAAGINILLQYRKGNAKVPESLPFAVSKVKWLGLHHRDMTQRGIALSHRQPVIQRDVALLKGLLSRREVPVKQEKDLSSSRSSGGTCRSDMPQHLARHSQSQQQQQQQSQHHQLPLQSMSVNCSQNYLRPQSSQLHCATTQSQHQCSQQFLSGVGRGGQRHNSSIQYSSSIGSGGECDAGGAAMLLIPGNRHSQHQHQLARHYSSSYHCSLGEEAAAGSLGVALLPVEDSGKGNVESATTGSKRGKRSRGGDAEVVSFVAADGAAGTKSVTRRRNISAGKVPAAIPAPTFLPPEWLSEVQLMEKCGFKAEIECLVAPNPFGTVGGGGCYSYEDESSFLPSGPPPSRVSAATNRSGVASGVGAGGGSRLQGFATSPYYGDGRDSFMDNSSNGIGAALAFSSSAPIGTFGHSTCSSSTGNLTLTSVIESKIFNAEYI